jgi:hypothetical protein
MPALDRDKLAKVLGMLGSRHDGEVVTAGRSAHILLKDAGVTWTEVLAPPDGADRFDRHKLSEAEAVNRRLLIELAQMRFDIDNLIAEHQQQIRKLQGAKHRGKTRELQGREQFSWIKTVIWCAAIGLAVFIGAMISSTQSAQILRGDAPGRVMQSAFGKILKIWP